MTADVAIWENPADQGSETKFRGVGKDAPEMTIGYDLELPSAAVTKDGLFVAYVSKVKDKRSVRLIKAGHK